MENRKKFLLRERRRLRVRLLRWFAANQRVLPWRQTRDPYRIWVAEVMLQQTRVGAVLEHYRRFLRRFPSVRALAAAPVDDVLAAWSGLGYYRRARALHAAAQCILREHAGRIPRSAAELETLPGIGRYTAAAVASIAFGQPCAVLDGNVERVLRRVLGRPKASTRTLWMSAEELISRRHPGDFNQAMMELGATVCLPRRPACSECPIRTFCRSRSAPAVAPKAPRRVRRAAYALGRRNGCVYLVRRGTDEPLMPGMWELPQLTAIVRADFVLRHAITTTDFRISVSQVDANHPALRGGRWVRQHTAARLPLTGLARKILSRTGVV